VQDGAAASGVHDHPARARPVVLQAKSGRVMCATASREHAANMLEQEVGARPAGLGASAAPSGTMQLHAAPCGHAHPAGAGWAHPGGTNVGTSREACGTTPQTRNIVGWGPHGIVIDLAARGLGHASRLDVRHSEHRLKERRRIISCDSVFDYAGRDYQ
jgi:hypothetical protein